MTSDLTIDEVRARYRTEREKRLRPDGNAQFRSFTGEFADCDRDPWVTPGFTRDPIRTDTTAVIVGGGFAGMLTAIELTRHGIREFVIVEKAGDFGGTWYWNRYPGCMCDVESYTYLPLLEETGYMPTERYASAAEIFGYCQLLADHFDLYPHALFQTEIASAAWDDDLGRWRIRTSRDDELTSRFFVTAGGILHKAKLPGRPGIDDFEGTMFHTARWDYAVTGGSPTEPMDRLADRRVGIIGTGATAVQLVPQLARAAADVFVFQRTPSAVGVRNQAPTDPQWFATLEPGWQQERLRNFTEAVTGQHPAHDVVDDGWTHLMWHDTQQEPADEDEALRLERLDLDTMRALRDRIDREVHDPETGEKLKPWYGKHCKRLCFHDDYLAAFNEPNVHLVDTDGRGVDRVTAGGVVFDGVEYPVDLLVFASGFEVTTALEQRLGFDPEGRGGVRLGERWADGAHTLHGVLSAEFPNLLVIGTIQAGFGVNFVHFLSESARHVAWIVAAAEREGIRSIEATVEAEEEWLGVLYGVAMGLRRYSGTCTPGYYNSEGTPGPGGARNLVYPGSLTNYVGHLERWRDAGDMPGARVER